MGDSGLQACLLFVFIACISSVPVLPGVSIKWIPGGENFRYGLEEVTLQHGETLAMQCNKSDHMTFYLVTRQEMDDCERSMSSHVVGTCGGNRGSTTVRQVMKTVSAGNHDLVWPAGTYYIIAIPAYQRRDLRDDYYCSALGMKLKVNVVPAGSLPPNRYGTPSQFSAPNADAHGSSRSMVAFHPMEYPTIPSQQLTKSPATHYPTKTERLPSSHGPYHHPLAMGDEYAPRIRSPTYESESWYARDDFRVIQGDPQYHRMMVKTQHPIPIHDWTLLDAEEEYDKASNLVCPLVLLPLIIAQLFV